MLRRLNKARGRKKHTMLQFLKTKRKVNLSFLNLWKKQENERNFLSPNEKPFTIDLKDVVVFVPLAKGGKNDFDNLQCACKSCNQLKGSMDYETFTQKAVAIILMRAEADQDFREELYKVLKSRKRIRKKIRAVSI